MIANVLTSQCKKSIGLNDPNSMILFHHEKTYIHTTLLRYRKAYISGAIWTIQPTTNILIFKYHWPHDLHDHVLQVRDMT